MKRCSANPILTRQDIPDIPTSLVNVTSVFNPGAIRFAEKYLLLLRVQTRGRETVLMMAESEDGQTFSVRPKVIKINGLETVNERIYHIYDPRLTTIDGTNYMMFAADVDEACRLGIATTKDFDTFELVSFDSSADTRNGVLFPEKINGKFVRFERPNRTMVEGGVSTGDAIILAESDDLVTWRKVGLVMEGRHHYWDELIGPGPPPIKTRDGWLLIYHGVARHFAAGIYQAGVVLLDLDDPGKVLARSRNNILEPRETYEMIGQVPNVVFPTGAVVQEQDADGFALPQSVVNVYYGAADTVVCLAQATITDLLNACNE